MKKYFLNHRHIYISLSILIMLCFIAPLSYSQQLVGSVSQIYTIQSSNNSNLKEIEKDITLDLALGEIGIIYKDSPVSLEYIAITVSIPQQFAQYANNFTLFTYDTIPNNIQKGDFYDIQSNLLSSVQLSQSKQTVVIPFINTNQSSSLQKKITKQTIIDKDKGIAFILQPNIKGFPIQIYESQIKVSVQTRISSLAILALRMQNDTQLIQSDLQKIMTVAINGIPQTLLSQNIAIPEGKHIISITGKSLNTHIGEYLFSKGKETIVSITPQRPKTAVLLLPQTIHEIYNVNINNSNTKQYAVELNAVEDSTHSIKLTKRLPRAIKTIELNAKAGISYKITKDLTIIPQ